MDSIGALFDTRVFLYQSALVGMLLAYLPVTAFAHYGFRRQRRNDELARIFKILNIEPIFRNTFLERNPAWHLSLSVLYCTMVSLFGMVLLFWGKALGLSELLRADFGDVVFPADGSLLMVGMAFLGAYLWGIRHVWRRYMLNDLFPGVYYRIAMRMITAGVVALVIFNAYEALAGGSGGGDGSVIQRAWPALALMIGMFPQNGINWLMARIPFFAQETDPSVQHLPLEMIEGIEAYDRMRFEELGINNGYELANADFIPLMLKAPYSARQLVDWILQAKLCVYFGPTVKDLRAHSIRTINDLNNIVDIDALVAETSVTRSALDRAIRSIQNDPEITRLCQAADMVSHFWQEKSSEQKTARAPSAH